MTEPITDLPTAVAALGALPMPAGSTRPIEDLDVPLPTLRDRMAALVERQKRDAAAERLRLLLAEQSHQVDTAADAAFARLACEHPEACSCNDDYPNWTPGGTS